MPVRLLLLLIAAPISQALAQVDADRWNLSDLYPSAAAWNADAAKLEAQMKVGGLAVGLLRTTREFAETEWAKERGAIVDVDDGAGGVIKVPAPPWRFSRSVLQPPTTVARRGADNVAVLTGLGLTERQIKQLEADRVLSHDAD